MFKWAVAAAFLVGMVSVALVRTFDRSPSTSSLAVTSQQAAAPAPACEDPKPEPLSLRLDGSGHAFGSLSTKSGEIRVMVDTGATMTALSTDDARRLGLPANDPKRKKARVQTANGVVTVELDQLLNVRLGHLCLYTLDVAVMPPGALHASLLGMNFLRKMRKVEVGQGRITIAQ